MRNSGISFCFTLCIKIGFCGCSQWDFMLCYSLNKPIALEKIVNDISKYIHSCMSQNVQDKVLVIKIENITNYAGDNPLPKIEYKP